MKKIRDSSGRLILRVRRRSKLPCSSEQPMSRGLEGRARVKLAAKVRGVQTELVARRPARIGLGLTAARRAPWAMRGTEVRQRARTEAAFSAASLSHWREKVGLTSKTA